MVEQVQCTCSAQDRAADHSILLQYTQIHALVTHKQNPGVQTNKVPYWKQQGTARKQYDITREQVSSAL